MGDTQNITKTTFTGDEGEAASAIAREVYAFHGCFGRHRNPERIIIGADLYERLTVNASRIPDEEGPFGRRLAGMAYIDTFMGIPLSVVPDKGFVRAIGSNMDMLHLYGGTPEGKM